jgi:hypothetical protein
MKQGLFLIFVLTSVVFASPILARDILDRAERLIKEHRLLSPKAQRCSMLVLRENSTRRVAMIGVYEMHNNVCGGDPAVAHRLFDLEIDMKTAIAKWDRNFPDMEMRPIPMRKR